MTSPQQLSRVCTFKCSSVCVHVSISALLSSSLCIDVRVWLLRSSLTHTNCLQRQNKSC